MPLLIIFGKFYLALRQNRLDEKVLIEVIYTYVIPQWIGFKLLYLKTGRVGGESKKKKKHQKHPSFDSVVTTHLDHPELNPLSGPLVTWNKLGVPYLIINPHLW